MILWTGILVLISLLAKKDAIAPFLKESADFTELSYQLLWLYESMNEVSMAEETRNEIEDVFTRAVDIVQIRSDYLEQLTGEEFEDLDDPFEALFEKLRVILDNNESLKNIYEVEKQKHSSEWKSLNSRLLPKLKNCMYELKSIKNTLDGKVSTFRDL